MNREVSAPIALAVIVLFLAMLFVINASVIR